ncbi:hypothetical protein PG988_007353 [Apiospora saccharicola]
MAGTKCADPRDRVYGMLAIINTKQTGLANVDYSLSVAGVYTAAAANYFQKAEYLDLLASCDLASDRIPELPSWVPDFSTSPKARAFLCNGLLAINTVPRVGFPNGPRGGVLRMPGVTKPSLKVKAVEVMGSSHTEAIDTNISGIISHDETVHWEHFVASSLYL